MGEKLGYHWVDLRAARMAGDSDDSMVARLELILVVSTVVCLVGWKAESKAGPLVDLLAAWRVEQ